MRRLTLATVTAILLLAGCSSGDGSDGAGDSDSDATAAPQSSGSTSASPQVPSDPECDEVWKAGKTLPEDYTTCVEDGEPVEPDAVACTDGSSLVVHRDSLYAVTGGTIVEPDVAPLQDTEEFGEAYTTCTGE